MTDEQGKVLADAARDLLARLMAVTSERNAALAEIDRLNAEVDRERRENTRLAIENIRLGNAQEHIEAAEECQRRHDTLDAVEKERDALRAEVADLRARAIVNDDSGGHSCLFCERAAEETVLINHKHYCPMRVRDVTLAAALDAAEQENAVTPTTHEVAGCAECRYRDENPRENYSRCDHPEVDTMENIHKYIDDWDDECCPAWCPLRTAPVLVSLKIGENNGTR